MGEEKVLKKVTQCESDFRRSRGRPKSRWEEQVLKEKNPQLEMKDPGSEVMEIIKEVKTSKTLE